jgi:hypothetical protein
VRSIDVDTYRVFVGFASPNIGSKRAKRFSDNYVGTAVQQPQWLPITFDRHCCYRFLCAQLKKFDSHTFGEFA